VVPSGQDNFNNIWAPCQSRLVLISGAIIADDVHVADILNQGDISLSIRGQNHALDEQINGSMVDTSSVINIVQPISLQQVDNVFVYNQALAHSQYFTTDQWGVESFINSGS
jgi:hypothetical protein